MLYCRELQTTGWNKENIQRLENLLWAHAIKAEEYYGLGFCTENLEYSTHAASDIKRHSSMDNYSCELYERAVKDHKKQKHNAKGLEKTFIQRESIRSFIHEFKQRHGDISSYDCTVKCQSSKSLDQPYPLLLKESSFAAAIQLLQDCNENHNPRIKHAMKCGIALGKINIKTLSFRSARDIKQYLKGTLGIQEVTIPNVVKTVKSVAVQNQFGKIVELTIKDSVIIESADHADEWIMDVKEIIIAGPIQESFHTFINGTYFVPVYENGCVVINSWTKTPHLQPRNYNRDSVQPISSFKRKVILFPDLKNAEPTFYLPIDIQRPNISTYVKVPIYPVNGDILKIKGPNHHIWYGEVLNVDVDTRKAEIKWLKETKRDKVWMASSRKDIISFNSILGLAKATATFGGVTVADI